MRTVASDPQALATKQDIRLLMEEIGKLYEATERWKEEILDATERWKEEIKQHFDLVAENIRGAFRDNLMQHEVRLGRVERHVGLT